MALIIPKMVVLKNDKLTWLYYSLYFGTVIIMTTYFVLSGGYNRIISIKEDIHLNMWVNTPDDMALNASMYDHMPDVCGRPRDYDYWYDEHWKYNGAFCVPVTSNCNRMVSMCMLTADIFFKESPTQVFLASYMSTKQVLPNGLSQPLGSFFLPQVEAFSVTFEYFFTAPNPNLLTLDAGVTKPPRGQEIRMKSAESVLTVFLDYNRDIVRIAAPGEPLTLTVPQMLGMAGYPDVLITPNPAWGANVFPNATYPAGPIGIIGGIPLELYVTCHQKPKMKLGTKWDYWTGPACFVIIDGQEVWSTKYQKQKLALDEGNMDVAQSGIRVSAVMDGTWELFDVNNSILNFAALLVLLGMPKKLITLIACRGLGHLSDIYRRVIYTRFFIAEQIAGMTARIVTHGASFRELENNDEFGGLTRDDLRETISHVTRFRIEHELSTGSRQKKTVGATTDDIQTFADFAYQAIAHPEAGQGRGMCGRLFSCLTTSRLVKGMEALMVTMGFDEFLTGQASLQPSEGESRISVDHFLSAASAAEPVGFEDLIWLFNKRRRVGFFERMFTPGHLTSFIEEAHRLSVQEKLRFSTNHGTQDLSQKWHDPREQPDAFKKVTTGFEMVDQQSADIRVSNRELIRQHAVMSRCVAEELKKQHDTMQQEMEDVRYDKEKITQLEHEVHAALSDLKGQMSGGSEVSPSSPRLGWSSRPFDVFHDMQAVRLSPIQSQGVGNIGAETGPAVHQTMSQHSVPSVYTLTEPRGFVGDIRPSLPAQSSLPDIRRPPTALRGATADVRSHARLPSVAATSVASTSLSVRQETCASEIQRLLKLEHSVQSVLKSLQDGSGSEYEQRKTAFDMLALRTKVSELDSQAHELSEAVNSRVRARLVERRRPTSSRMQMQADL